MKHRFLGILALVVNEKTYFCTLLNFVTALTEAGTVFFK